MFASHLQRRSLEGASVENRPSPFPVSEKVIHPPACNVGQGQIPDLPNPLRFRLCAQQKNYFKIDVDNLDLVVHIHIYDVKRTKHGHCGKLRVLQLAQGGAGGDPIL